MKKLIMLSALIFHLTLISQVPKGNLAVKIGSQIWQTTNLDLATYQDGTIIPQVTDPHSWAYLKTGAWCYLNNDSANGLIYGKLYNWYAVAGIYDEASLKNPSLRKQLAPQGWHIPNDSELAKLIAFLGGKKIAGGKIKEKGVEHWRSTNVGATNSSGFRGLAGGFREAFGTFSSGGFYPPPEGQGWWWSYSEEGYEFSWHLWLDHNYTTAWLDPCNKNYGCSVRCIKD